jgi:hypothetical protein
MQSQWVVVVCLSAVSILVALCGAATAISVARRGQRQVGELVTAAHRQAVLLAREEDRTEAYRMALEYMNEIRLEFLKISHGELDNFIPPDIGSSAPLLATIATHGGPTAAHLLSEFLMQVPTTTHYAGRLMRAPRDDERRHAWSASIRELEERHDAFAAHAYADLDEPLSIPDDTSLPIPVIEPVPDQAPDGRHSEPATS